MHGNKDLPVSPEAKYQLGIPLNASDLFLIKRDIIQSGDTSTLESRIYLFGSSYPKDDEVLESIDHVLFGKGVPGLSAVCLKVATEFWGLADDKYLKLMSAFLDYGLYDDWYDEVIFSAGFAKRHPGLISNGDELLKRLVEDAESNGEAGLFDLLTHQSK